jgi:hypothetical protein
MAIQIVKRPVEGRAKATNACRRRRFSVAKLQKISALFLEFADLSRNFIKRISVKRIRGSFYPVQF